VFPKAFPDRRFVAMIGNDLTPIGGDLRALEVT
jgi:hypothetical protein